MSKLIRKRKRKIDEEQARKKRLQRGTGKATR
jgi:hypothetical protein